jgi:ligand-binding sensor domain-containing protein
MPSITEDSEGHVWIANLEHGLFRVSLRGQVQQIPWASLGHKDFATALAADRLQGGLWLGFVFGGVAYFNDGQVRASYSALDGLGEGRVTGFQLDQDGIVWVATEHGLSRLKNGGSIATLNSRNGLPCDEVHWVKEDEAKSFGCT